MSEFFSEDDYHALLDRETLVQELVESPGWQALQEVARPVLEAQRARVMSGDLEPDAYMKVAYQLRGAEFVLGLPAEIGGIVREYRRQLAEREQTTE